MIWTYKPLEQPCKLVEEEPAAGKYVKKFDLALTNAVVTGRPGADSLVYLFNRLTSLSELTPLPALTTLVLEDSLEGSPFDPSHFDALQRYPNLSRLGVISTSRHQEQRSAYLPSPNRPRLALKRLELDGHLSKDTAAFELVSSCPYLSRL
ncbi:hypothetical protein JCM8547_000030 [Rhodosporidiobolus lusitaniae]